MGFILACTAQHLKSNYRNYHINTLKRENMIIPRDVEKIPDKIQHHLIIKKKFLEKTRNTRKYPHP